VVSSALTTTLSLVRPFSRPCTFMAKLYCDGSWIDAWERHQTCFQGMGPSTPRRADGWLQWPWPPQPLGLDGGLSFLKGHCLLTRVRSANAGLADGSHPSSVCHISRYAWVCLENAGGFTSVRDLGSLSRLSLSLGHAQVCYESSRMMWAVQGFLQSWTRCAICSQGILPVSHRNNVSEPQVLGTGLWPNGQGG
jgi:hypothetical protein